MGDFNVSKVGDEKQMRVFMRNLLNDVQALEYMLNNDKFETGITRIGAEQEMCLVDKYWKPSSNAMEILKKLKKYEWVETELAKFNLEITLTPHEFKGKCLSKMEAEIQKRLDIIRKKANDLDTEILLCGIMPTIRKFDLDIDKNLTDIPRYRALMEAIDDQRAGDAYELRLSGIDELLVKHDTPMLEACNTSFQVHLQVEPKEFVRMYNIAQALAGPVIAISANSPILFGKRLWHETRIALFQQSLDTRASQDHLRERSPRVSFGKDWLQDSILEIYKEDIMRFRVLLSSNTQEDAIEILEKGGVPGLKALQVHNGTVYRWNRPCYGAPSGMKPHLRIECRVLPAGPTVVDEMASAAFWLGAMTGLALKHDDIRKQMSFDDASDNFIKASRTGLDSKFTWFKDKKISAADLVIKELLPIAREGLKHRKVDSKDIDKYLGIIEERARKHTTGARWALRTYTKLIKETNPDEALTVLTAATVQNQKKGIPIHEWKIPNLEDIEEYMPNKLMVAEFMNIDLITVQKNDILDLVADMMNWRKTRYIPVEDTKGQMVGLVTSSMLLHHFTRKDDCLKDQPITLVKDIMITEPITVPPDTPITDALEKMQKHRVGCLLVVKDGELMGIITEEHFLQITNRLMKRLK